MRSSCICSGGRRGLAPKRLFRQCLTSRDTGGRHAEEHYIALDHGRFRQWHFGSASDPWFNRWRFRFKQRIIAQWRPAIRREREFSDTTEEGQEFTKSMNENQQNWRLWHNSAIAYSELSTIRSETFILTRNTVLFFGQHILPTQEQLELLRSSGGITLGR